MHETTKIYRMGGGTKNDPLEPRQTKNSYEIVESQRIAKLTPANEPTAIDS